MKRRRETLCPARLSQGEFHSPTVCFRSFRRVPAGHAASAVIGVWASRNSGPYGKFGSDVITAEGLLVRIVHSDELGTLLSFRIDQ